MSSRSDAEIRRFIKKATNLYGEKEVKKQLNKAAKPLINAARVNIPVAKKDITHTKKSGAKVIYKPGNLKRSIRRLYKLGKRHKSPDNVGVHIGAKLAGRNASGTYGGNRVDGFYAHFFEDGAKDKHGNVRVRARRFWANAVNLTKNQIKKDVAQRMINMIRKGAKRKGIN